MDDLANGQNSHKLSPAALFMAVITDPETAFNSIKNYPSWLFPVLLSLLLGMGYMATTQDIQLKMQREYILESEMIPEAAKDKQLENLENPTFMQQTVFPGIAVIIGSFAVPAVIAGVLMLFGNFVFGGNTKFNIMFSAAAWAGIISFIEGLIKLPLVLNKESLEIYSSLALFMDLNQSDTFLFQILNIIDVFAIWKIVVYAIAFSVIYKFSKGKSYATITSLYLVSSLIGIGFTQIFT